MYSKEQILDFISGNKLFLRNEFHIIRIGLFGSYARGMQTNNSDIDLILEFEENTNDLFTLKESIRKFFQSRFGLNVDICREKYIKPKYKKRILKEAIYVE